LHRQRVASLRIFVALLAAISLAGVTLAGQAAPPKNDQASKGAFRGRRWSPRSVGVPGSTNAATPAGSAPDEISWPRDADRRRSGAAEGESRRVVQAATGDAAFGDSNLHRRRSTTSLARKRGSSPGTSQRATTTRSGSWGGGSENRTSLISESADWQAAAADGLTHRRGRRRGGNIGKPHPFDGPEDIALVNGASPAASRLLGAG